MKDSLFPSQ